MLTFDDLMAFAEKAEQLYRERSALYPSGTVDDARNDARRQMENALVCAAWLERSGITALTFVGPFGPVLPQRGDRVRIAKGAEIRSTHPKKKGGVTNGRILTVTVLDAYPGYVDRYHGHPEVVQPKIQWVGAGGYFRWTDACNLVVESPASDAEAA